MIRTSRALRLGVAALAACLLTGFGTPAEPEAESAAEPSARGTAAEVGETVEEPKGLILSRDIADEALTAIHGILPDTWQVSDIEWDTVPTGWGGEPECVYVRLEDLSISFFHPTLGFRYHPFYKLWILPPGWEGRMEVTEIKPTARGALYLGENADLRVFYRTLGRNTWPEGTDELTAALDLVPFPLSHLPQHTLDVNAMQRLLQRLDSVPSGDMARWQRQLYAIAELPQMVYLELLTWEDRKGRAADDPFFLGDLAEKETRYLSREVIATFPTKKCLYLRRVTREKFSDVLIVNPAFFAVGP